MKKTFLLLILLTLQIMLNAQNIIPKVFASSGNSFSNASYSFDYTIGEMALVDTKQNPQLIITQGFHQPENSLVNINEQSGDSVFFFVYPNPVNEFIQIQFLNDGLKKASIRIYDLTSRVIFSEEKYVERGTIERIYSNRFVSGSYFIEVIVKGDDSTYIKHLQKIQIIH